MEGKPKGFPDVVKEVEKTERIRPSGDSYHQSISRPQ